MPRHAGPKIKYILFYNFPIHFKPDGSLKEMVDHNILKKVILEFKNQQLKSGEFDSSNDAKIEKHEQTDKISDIQIEFNGYMSDSWIKEDEVDGLCDLKEIIRKTFEHSFGDNISEDEYSDNNINILNIVL